jgi:hypothetical protein
MLFILQRLLRLFVEMDLEIPPSIDAVETLLATTRFGDLSSRRHLLTTAAKLQKDSGQAHLQAEIVYQQSVLLRLEGKICDSKRVVRKFLDSPYLEAGSKSHFLLGLLHLS